MSRRYPQPVFLDATVLSNFASSDAVGFLETILDSPVVVPAVRDEIERGQNLGHEYLTPAVDAFDDELPVGDRPAEDAAIRKRLDAGEAAALRGALERDGTLATDDLAARGSTARFSEASLTLGLAARRLADDLSVPVTGSIGLLVPRHRTGPNRPRNGGRMARRLAHRARVFRADRERQ